MPTTPKTIEEYLAQLNAALGDADPALKQDAQYDAEEYLRSELAEHPEWDEAKMLANVATSYGAPEEVADIYRDKEVQVESALRSPPRVRPEADMSREQIGLEMRLLIMPRKSLRSTRPDNTNIEKESANEKTDTGKK